MLFYQGLFVPDYLFYDIFEALLWG